MNIKFRRPTFSLLGAFEFTTLVAVLGAVFLTRSLPDAVGGPFLGLYVALPLAFIAGSLGATTSGIAVRFLAYSGAGLGVSLMMIQTEHTPPVLFVAVGFSCATMLCSLRMVALKIELGEDISLLWKLVAGSAFVFGFAGFVFAVTMILR